MTFTFTMDAFPANTIFDKSKEVLCAIQIIEETSAETEELETIFPGDVKVLDTDIVDNLENPSEAG